MRITMQQIADEAFHYLGRETFPVVWARYYNTE